MRPFLGSVRPGSIGGKEWDFGKATARSEGVSPGWTAPKRLYSREPAWRGSRLPLLTDGDGWLHRGSIAGKAP